MKKNQALIINSNFINSSTNIFLMPFIIAGMCQLYGLSVLVYLSKFISHLTQVHKICISVTFRTERGILSIYGKTWSIKCSLADAEIWVMKCPFSREKQKSHTNYTDPIRRNSLPIAHRPPPSSSSLSARYQANQWPTNTYNPS